jgi:hypothetical protein
MNSPVFTVIEARPWHCGRMARLLRIEHASAIARLGIDSHRELSSRFGESAFRRAWLIDGELAALGGVTGPQMAAWGFLWLALSERARRYPVAIVKEAKRQLAEIMVVKRELATTILDNDAAARGSRSSSAFMSRTKDAVRRRDRALHGATCPASSIPSRRRGCRSATDT